MTYLFWAYAVVWGGIFLYLYALSRRSQALAREVEALRAEMQQPVHLVAAPADRSRAGRA